MTSDRDATSTRFHTCGADGCVQERQAEIIAWGDGSPTREFLYVEDAAEGILPSTAEGGQRWLGRPSAAMALLCGVERMNGQEMERLVRKYYGYVADLEGSGVEALDLLFVRDKIQQLLDASGPEEQIPIPLFEQIHDLDQALWAESETFRVVVGDRELQHARRQQRSPRSHWWWYLDELKTAPQPGPKPRSHIAPVLVPA